MEKGFLHLDFSLPFVFTSELVNDRVVGTTTILSPLEGLN
jgi:hypothetical protein